MKENLGGEGSEQKGSLSTTKRLGNIKILNQYPSNYCTKITLMVGKKGHRPLTRRGEKNSRATDETFLCCHLLHLEIQANFAFSFMIYVVNKKTALTFFE